MLLGLGLLVNSNTNCTYHNVFGWLIVTTIIIEFLSTFLLGLCSRKVAYILNQIVLM